MSQLELFKCKVSNEAKKFRGYARQVKVERYRATAFIRLKPIDQHRVLMGEFEIKHQTDEYEKYWFAYYKSQFIPERKNLRYLKQVIPKKYWKWVTELREFGLT